MSETEDWLINFPVQIEGFVCRSCGTQARCRDNNNQEWACIQCPYYTASVSIYFKPIETDEPAYRGDGEET